MYTQSYRSFFYQCNDEKTRRRYGTRRQILICKKDQAEGVCDNLNFYPDTFPFSDLTIFHD